MIAPGQRVVPVKMARTFLYKNARRTLVLFLCLAVPAFAQDAGVSDAPIATRLESGHLDLNPAAEKHLDDEMKRLQQMERNHRSESWLTVVLVAVGAGLLVGAAAGASVALAVASKKP